MENTYYKLIWKNENGDGIAIVKNLKYYDRDRISPDHRDDENDIPVTASTIINEDAEDIKEDFSGVLVYGSRAKYSKSGRWFVFNNPDMVIKLDPEYVLKRYFLGLI